MTETTLLPCPFCGGDDASVKQASKGDTHWYEWPTHAYTAHPVHPALPTEEE